MRTVDPKKTSSTRPGTSSIPTSPIRTVAEAVAAEHKKADDELARRMMLDVLGDPGDPLKAAIEKVIPERVDRQGNRTSNKDRV